MAPIYKSPPRKATTICKAQKYLIGIWKPWLHPGWFHLPGCKLAAFVAGHRDHALRRGGHASGHLGQGGAPRIDHLDLITSRRPEAAGPFAERLIAARLAAVVDVSLGGLILESELAPAIPREGVP